ncbi:helix-turn-helix domain-containing protein [Haladaptatus salinisoli]|uniref:helix-turn-helix domain-containing protein n=1 Tax=Haladaptatus salinisoli TaxID=2884876 RepID=UPI001D0AB8F1|nr:helix-turn-helix domain-containing protein [Haladaptatus salinisoli]
MYETSFKIRHECPYREFSERFPDVTIREWHHHDCQVLELSSTTAPSEDLLEEIQHIGDVLHSTTDDDGLYVVAQSCKCPIEDSIIKRFQNHSCVYTPPTIYRQGWEHYTVIGFDESDIQGVLQDLDESREIDVLSKTSIEKRQLPQSTLFSVDRLFAGLTDRQLAALRLALDNGYYSQPRDASTKELAEQTNIARATFEEHLRKAENKLLMNVEPFIRLLTETQVSDILGTRSSLSSEIAKID